MEPAGVVGRDRSRSGGIPHRALLTNRDSLGSFIKRASGLPFRNVVSVADESELSESWPAWSRPVPAGTWATETPLPQSPWSYPLESQLLDLPATGWHNYRIPIGSSNATKLTVYESRYVELLGYVLLVGVAGIAAAFLRGRTRWMLLAIGCFTAVTLLCPLEWVPVTRGVLLGLTLGLTWTAVRRIPCLSRPRRSHESSVATPLPARGLGATAVQILLLVLIAVLATRSAFSAEATAAPPPTEPQPAATAAEETAPPVTPAIPATPSPDPTDRQSQEPYALVSPVDDQGQPTGGYVYMPRAFYEALHKISASPRLSSQSWLIQSAAYRVTLNSADPALELGESPRVLAEYDAAVLEAGTKIELPLSRAEVTVLDAMLDGQAVPPLWDEAGTSLSFAVESPRQAAHLAGVATTHADKRTVIRAGDVDSTCSSVVACRPGGFAGKRRGSRCPRFCAAGCFTAGDYRRSRAG